MSEVLFYTGVQMLIVFEWQCCECFVGHDVGYTQKSKSEYVWDMSGVLFSSYFVTHNVICLYWGISVAIDWTTSVVHRHFVGMP